MNNFYSKLRNLPNWDNPQALSQEQYLSRTMRITSSPFVCWRYVIASRGLKPGFYLVALRGAEAPLFHGAIRRWCSTALFHSPLPRLSSTALFHSSLQQLGRLHALRPDTSGPLDGRMRPSLHGCCWAAASLLEPRLLAWRWGVRRRGSIWDCLYLSPWKRRWRPSSPAWLRRASSSRWRRSRIRIQFHL